MNAPLKAPFPYFGGKRSVVSDVWRRLGRPKQYIEPFCGSAAVLLGAEKPASLEVVGDANGFIANFWRAVKYQPAEVAHAADYPVSHIDQGARHAWLKQQVERLAVELHDPFWPGDALVAGWWLWGQCSWIGSGWCDWHVGDAGRDVQAAGQVPRIDCGTGPWGIDSIPRRDDLLTSGGTAAWDALHKLARRLDRVRVIHGDWNRCLNHHYGGNDTAVFLDPPYRAYEKLYGVSASVADAVADWARENGHLRVAIFGHVGDYDLPGWDAVQWDRGRLTYGGGKTTAEECIWYSSACHSVATYRQESLL